MIIDLTHTLRSNIPTWPGDPSLSLHPSATIAADSWYLQTITLGEHTGTHIGVAAHMTDGGMTIENLPADLLIRPAIVIDVREAMDNYLLDLETIQQWESGWGMIEKGSVVLLNTGWDRYWIDNDHESYMGVIPSEAEPADQPLFTGYPGYSLDAARFLAEERDVIGLGIDTAGIDGGHDTAFSVNRYWLRGERYHLENLTGLDRLPPRGATIFIGALPIDGGSGSPVRVLAMVP